MGPNFAACVLAPIFFLIFILGPKPFSLAQVPSDSGEIELSDDYDEDNLFESFYLADKQNGETPETTLSSRKSTVSPASLLTICFNETSESDSSTSTTPTSITTQSSGDDICKMTPRQIIEHHGYKMAEVEVTTKDGYILTMWRICKRTDPPNCQKTFVRSNRRHERYPVLVQHGLVSSGEDWLYLDKETILPLMLVNAGYDVFVGNSRGNKYSRKHKTLDSSDNISPYWNYSFHEMGVYDVPAAIDKVLELTQSPKINYMGYSMGSTQFFIMKSEQPEYLKKVEKFVALAPALYIGNFSTQLEVIKCLLQNDKILKPIVENLFYGEGKFGVLTDSEWGVMIRRAGVPGYLVPHLQRIERLLTGMDGEKFLDRLIKGRPLLKNRKAYECAMSNSFLSGASRRTVRHFVQFVTSNKFQKYDYRIPSINKQQYNQTKPPEYNVNGTTNVRLLVLYGEKDSICSPDDMVRASAGSKNWGGVHNCSVPCFHHLDFVYGPNKPTKRNVYDVAVEWLQGRSFNNGRSGCHGDPFLNDPDYCNNMVE